LEACQRELKWGSEFAMQCLMGLFSKLVSSGVHPCLHCGSFLKTEGLLCNPCRDLVSSYLSSTLEGSQFLTFQIYAAFRWRPGASDLLSRQLVHLKGARAFRDWNYWAERFVQRRQCLSSLNRPIRIVPAPSSTGNKDHAFFWAQALSQQVGGELFPCLKKAQSHKQRWSSLSDRLGLQFDLDENNSELPIDWSEVLWVFADDIVTTGSTALAAYKALGSPPHFEVWTLAKRTLSCGASTDLL